MHPGQREVSFDIYQGESRRLEHNVKLGSLALPLPPGDARQRELRVRFTYDINGLLEVDTSVAGTEVRRSLVIEGNPGFLPPEEVARRLRELQALKIHPRDEMENRALLARGERLFEESLGEERRRVAALLARFEAVLAAQDRREVKRAREELALELDRLESGPRW
jgi:molecular chaperone HscC